MEVILLGIVGGLYLVASLGIVGGLYLVASCMMFYLLMWSNTPFSVKMLHKLRIVRGVVLTDVWGKEYYSWVKDETPWGFKFAHVYPFGRVGGVWLKPDGKTEGESSYIESWRDI